MLSLSVSSGAVTAGDYSTVNVTAGGDSTVNYLALDVVSGAGGDSTGKAPSLLNTF